MADMPTDGGSLIVSGKKEKKWTSTNVKIQKAPKAIAKLRVLSDTT